MLKSISPINIINESPCIAAGIALSTISLAVPKINKYAKYTIAIIIIAVLIIIMWFYRHPTHTLPADIKPGDVVSPAYGTVYEILPVEKEGKQYNHISIFLSPLDVHVQYIPIDSTFISTAYDATGKFNLAYEMNKSNDNEKAITIIRPKHDSGESMQSNNIYITQIAGYLVRRINTKKFVSGEELKMGQELGMIKFGSRVDIELPDDYEILVKEGDYLYGPNTIIAAPHPADASPAR
jgi:phosphatidylserine decarboxylase